jgi:hypothetical protein
MGSILRKCKIFTAYLAVNKLVNLCSNPDVNSDSIADSGIELLAKPANPPE